MFDPNFAAQTLTAALVAELSIVMPIAQHISIADLQRELPCYTSAARSVSFSSDDVDLYTDAVLSFWAQAPSGANGMPTWVRAAKIAFAMTPNSASCERVFSMLSVMWGEQQLNSLADAIQASLMLRYNGNRREKESVSR